MTFVRRALAALAVIAIPAVAVLAQTGSPALGPEADAGAAATGQEIVVSVFPYGDIVVNGRVRRCQRMVGDPLDKVRLRVEVDPHSGAPLPRYLAIIPSAEGGFVSVLNNEQVTGPEFWQRVGVGMDRYVFRAPASGRPMCIGGRRGSEESGRFAGFRRIVDAAPYRGHRLRFTAQVATGRAAQVNFWLAAGNEWRESDPRARRAPRHLLLNGGSTNELRFGGTRDWTPVALETGPIDQLADHVSYGFNLQGPGDVWIVEPKLEIVGGGPGGVSASALAVTGLEHE